MVVAPANIRGANEHRAQKIDVLPGIDLGLRRSRSWVAREQSRGYAVHDADPHDCVPELYQFYPWAASNVGQQGIALPRRSWMGGGLRWPSEGRFLNEQRG